MITDERRCPRWPGILPKAHQENLRARRGLKDRFLTYEKAARSLSIKERESVLQALEDENRISELLVGGCECATLPDLPKAIQGPAADLFEFSYHLLTDLGIRDIQYEEIYRTMRHKICPFCGLEDFDSPEAPRHDLDHYLAKSRYPFAAVNLRNLAPMGDRCNKSYKKNVDMLRCTRGVRRKSFDPYLHKELEISLDDSIPFGRRGWLPEWIVGFEPDSPEVATWDDVFSVRERYCRDSLDVKFSQWLEIFAGAAKKDLPENPTDAELINALTRHENLRRLDGLDGRAFLQAAVFRMLRKHCEGGHQILLRRIRLLLKKTPNPPKS